MKPLLLAHLSDLHLSAEHRRMNLRRAKRLLEFVLRSNVDHLVVTGDITANATNSDLQVARSLFGSFGLLDHTKLTVIPGNHDVYGGVHTAEDILTFPGRCRRTDVGGKLNAFVHAFRETFRSCLQHSPAHPFPFAKIIGDVVLFGTSSIAPYSGVKNPLGSNGEIDRQQYHHLKKLLYFPALEKRRKLMLIHHHFNKGEPAGSGALQNVWSTIERQTMKLRGKKDLLRLLRNGGVDLVLHGHVHQNCTYGRRGVVFLNGGGSVMDAGEGVGLVNFVRVGREGIDIETQAVPAEVLRVTRSAEMPDKTLSEHAAA
jgi:3',5'-cyclic-AMP phosphodiesterase